MHEVTAQLVRHYDACLATHGPTPRGMDWGDDPARLELRFDAIRRAVGLDRPGPSVRLLDAGCGCGLLLDHLERRSPGRVDYVGVDASERMIAAARTRHPSARWLVADVTEDADLPRCDVVVANGLLTERRDVPDEDMERFARAALRSLFDRCGEAMVFNVLTSHVNYRDPILFYWDPGAMLRFACDELSRHVVLYHDLELYEVFCLVRRGAWIGPA